MVMMSMSDPYSTLPSSMAGTERDTVSSSMPSNDTLSPYGAYLNAEINSTPYSDALSQSPTQQCVSEGVSHAQLLQVLRESSSLSKKIIDDLASCSVPYAAAHFLTVLRMCTTALNRLEKHLPSLINECSLLLPQSLFTMSSKTHAPSSLLRSNSMNMSSQVDSSNLKHDQTTFRKTNDINLTNNGSTANWNSVLMSPAWVSTRTTSGLWGGNFSIKFDMAESVFKHPLRVGIMLEWVAPTGKKCVDWGDDGTVGSSQSSWCVCIDPVEAGAPEDEGHMCVKFYDAGEFDNEVNATVPVRGSSISVLVDVTIPTCKPGLATFHIVLDDFKDAAIKPWRVRLPPGSVIIPAISVCSREHVVTLKVAKTTMLANEVSILTSGSAKDKKVLTADEMAATEGKCLPPPNILHQPQLSQLSVSFLFNCVVQVQNALVRFACHILHDFDDILNQAPIGLKQTTRDDRSDLDKHLDKALNNPRARRILEHDSTFLCASVDPLRMVLHFLYLSSTQHEASNKINPTSGKNRGINGEGRWEEDELYASSYGNCFHDDVSHVDVTDKIITDPDGLKFWVSSFVRGTFQVPWDVFLSSIETYLKDNGNASRLRTDQKRNLKVALDNAESGWVNMHSWAALLQGFGPGIARTIDQMDSSLRKPWFHGFISGSETREALYGCRVGTFLVRFSQSKQCAFVIAYVDASNSVKQTIVEATRNQGFCISGTRGKHFNSLADVITEYSHLLKFPAPNTLSKCRWFHGFLTYTETVDILSDEAVGTYLMRFSKSQPGSMVLAFRVAGLKNNKGKVQQSLIYSSPETGGYRVGSKLYPDLESIIKDNSDRLKLPCIASPFEKGNYAITGGVTHSNASHSVGQTENETDAVQKSDPVNGMFPSMRGGHPYFDYVASLYGIGYYSMPVPGEMPVEFRGAATLAVGGPGKELARSEPKYIQPKQSPQKLAYSSIPCALLDQESMREVKTTSRKGNTPSANPTPDSANMKTKEGTYASINATIKKRKKADAVDYPDEFICPISLCVMKDPVIGNDSITYERASIEKWLEDHGTSPHTRQPMDVSCLKPNRALLSSIKSYSELAQQLQSMSVK